jgi:hypothetical protein
MWIKEINAWLKKHNVDPESCSITKSDSIFLKREIKGHSVYMEYFLESEDSPEQLVVNIYYNKEQKLATAGNVEDMLKMIDLHIL